jgi:hypothetical protein
LYHRHYLRRRFILDYTERTTKQLVKAVVAVAVVVVFFALFIVTVNKSSIIRRPVELHYVMSPIYTYHSMYSSTITIEIYVLIKEQE